MRFKITVTPENHGIALHELDENVGGEYFREAESSEAALDLFHGSVPIKMLEQFQIDVEHCPTQTEQDIDFICLAARDFMDLLEADQEDQHERHKDPDTLEDIEKIGAALERLGR